MSKYEITIEVDNNQFEDEKAIIEQIQQSMGNALSKVEEVPTVSDRDHVIYSQGDIPCEIYFTFDEFENLEFSHIERVNNHHSDEVINTPLQNSLLHCSCGELNLASEQEAIEHLKKNTSTISTSKKDIRSYEVDDHTLIRRGETARGRRSEEVIHRTPETDGLVTFVSVRDDSESDPTDKALSRVMDDEEWENVDVVHKEGDIYVVRLSLDGDASEQMDTSGKTTPELTEEYGHRNFSTDEMVTFVSVHALSRDSAVKQASESLTFDGSTEIVHQKNDIYVVRFSTPFENRPDTIFLSG